MIRKIRHAIALLVLVALGLAACGSDSTGPEDDDEFTPPDLSTPENLAQVLVQSLETMDIELLAYLLFDGDTQREDYEPYRFYFAPNTTSPDGTPLYEFDLESEIATLANLFSGDPGHDGDGEVPGVSSIDLALLPVQTWNPPLGDEVHGHAFPPGTLRAKFETDMTILLKGSFGDGFTGFDVDDELELHAIPVTVGTGDDARSEYRLWKWEELYSGGGLPSATESTNWGSVKAIYMN